MILYLCIKYESFTAIFSKYNEQEPFFKQKLNWKRTITPKIIEIKLFLPTFDLYFMGMLDSLFGVHPAVFCWIKCWSAMFHACTFCSSVVGVRFQNEEISQATAPTAYIRPGTLLRNVLYTAFKRQVKHCRHLKEKKEKISECSLYSNCLSKSLILSTAMQYYAGLLFGALFRAMPHTWVNFWT